MTYQYAIEDLASKCQVSKQSIYNLLSKDKDFIKQNSTRQARKIKYNQAVLNKLLLYYNKPEETDHAQEAIEAPTIVSETSPDKTTNETTEAIVAPLKAEIEALKKELEELRQQLAAKEAERMELLKQNGALILTLQQEKQEKQALLPAPKKSFGDRLKGLFSKSS